MEDFFDFQHNEKSEWECVVVGFRTKTPLIYRPSEGNVPNWFHRKMQELCFGVKWRRTR